MNDIGKNMNKWRTKNGLLIREAAAQCQVGESQWSKWENGNVTPSTAALRKFVQAGILTPEQALGLDGAA